MLSNPNITVVAYIPSSENPRLYLHDADGNPLAKEHEHGSKTYEATLREIGNNAIKLSLSVDYRLDSYADPQPGIIAYQTKPVDVDPSEHGLQWLPAPHIS